MRRQCCPSQDSRSKYIRSKYIRSSAVLLLALLTGCEPAAAPVEQPEPMPAQEAKMQNVPQDATAVVAGQAALSTADPALLFAEIKAMVGTAAATEPAHCKKTPLGHKPCGGPSSYLIYSSQGLDEALLLQKVSLYNQLVQAEQQRLGLVSDCAVVPEPGVALVGGFCVASDNGNAF